MSTTVVVSLSQLSSTAVATYGSFDERAFVSDGLKSALIRSDNNANFTEAQAEVFIRAKGVSIKELKGSASIDSLTP